MEAREYHTVDKSDWGHGPWQEEPDKMQFVDQATGLPCLIVRNPMSGSLCGYVGVSENHKAFGLHYDHEVVRDIDVHRGLTFSDHCADKSEEADNVWWFGFDCAHSGDQSPGMDAKLRSIGSTFGCYKNDRYRTVGYVKRNIAKLALQLNDL